MKKDIDLTEGQILSRPKVVHRNSNYPWNTEERARVSYSVLRGISDMYSYFGDSMWEDLRNFDDGTDTEISDVETVQFLLNQLSRQSTYTYTISRLDDMLYDYNGSTFRKYDLTVSDIEKFRSGELIRYITEANCHWRNKKSKPIGNYEWKYKYHSASSGSKYSFSQNIIWRDTSYMYDIKNRRDSLLRWATRKRSLLGDYQFSYNSEYANLSDEIFDAKEHESFVKSLIADNRSKLAYHKGMKDFLESGIHPWSLQRSAIEEKKLDKIRDIKIKNLTMAKKPAR